MNAVDIAAIEPGDARLASIYRDLLAPAFPPDQLDTLADLRDAHDTGQAHILAALDAAGRPLGAAIAEWYDRAGVVLLAYLAVDPAHRSHGIGGHLLETALDAWVRRFSPSLIVAEIERPDRAADRPEWGDPARRHAFYKRHGAQTLELPYFQPALREGSHRERGMLLITLHIDPSVDAGPGRVTAAPVRDFLHAYFTATEGRMPDDEETAALMRAATAPDGIPITAPTGNHPHGSTATAPS
ncbi:GNAT family N-acetyltransferase [Glycomyces sp. YM15]|uniref:GNAT family N-acetyltransferase n=1 Tax=Glycomyces sp. YM15 TaxID=2800446 RepID=UPI001965DFFD|nr:GNAT family N-acetyltransferase [Glycomyces sp. YM15]